MSDYWFARRFPVGHPRKAMAPVRVEGWLVMIAFVVLLMAGAAIGAWLAVAGAPLWGVVAFALIGLISGFGFVAIANRKGDHARTVADYRKLAPGAHI